MASKNVIGFPCLLLSHHTPEAKTSVHGRRMVSLMSRFSVFMYRFGANVYIPIVLCIVFGGNYTFHPLKADSDGEA